MSWLLGLGRLFGSKDISSSRVERRTLPRFRGRNGSEWLRICFRFRGRDGFKVLGFRFEWLRLCFRFQWLSSIEYNRINVFSVVDVDFRAAV